MRTANHRRLSNHIARVLTGGDQEVGNQGTGASNPVLISALLGVDLITSDTVLGVHGGGVAVGGGEEQVRGLGQGLRANSTRGKKTRLGDLSLDSQARHGRGDSSSSSCRREGGRSRGGFDV